MSVQRWRCTVCNYIHEGAAPPEKCPVCGVGAEKFVPVEGEAAMEEKERKELRQKKEQIA